jgi:hypothetical protein
MGRELPTGYLVTGGTERRVPVVHREKFPVAVVMGIVTGGAVEVVDTAEDEVRRRRRNQLRVGQRAGVRKGNRVMA